MTTFKKQTKIPTFLDSLPAKDGQLTQFYQGAINRTLLGRVSKKLLYS